MKIKTIPLSDLSTNKANDRHGELSDEQSAIEWLLIPTALIIDLCAPNLAIRWT